MQITITPHFYGILLVIIPLPFQVLAYFTRKSDIKRKQIFILNLCFISLNIVWYLTLVNPMYSSTLEFILSGISIITALYLYHYWTREAGIEEDEVKTQIFRINMLLLFFIITFVKAWDIISQDSFFIATYLYIQLLALRFAGEVVLQVIVKSNLRKSLTIVAILFSSVVACFIPFVLFFFDNSLLKYLAINLGFFFITIAYLRDYVVQTRLDYSERSNHLKLLDKYQLQSQQLDEYKKRLSEISSQKNLASKIDEILARYPEMTERQIQVTKLIAMSVSYDSIGEQLFISKDTVRKHAQDASLKMGMKGYKKLRHFVLKEVKNLDN